MMRRFLPFALALLAAPAQAAEPDPALYAQRCAMCHGAGGQGTHEVPALTGAFVARWAGAPVADLQAYITRVMPQHAPGTLSAEEAARITAFLMALNGQNPAQQRVEPLRLSVIH
ncbi:cytochrome c [Novosphingobium umbonatum]|uniref:Cytochrome c n=1 Tax=Novosphingobium umbonatum TaxID=1908524 RepID=A0A437NDI4_9SPHN|nr:cytochrome c [Novosphingobium umbonatum]RVU07862.1 cytochrome c [Novosphingobium umbonatum]